MQGNDHKLHNAWKGLRWNAKWSNTLKIYTSMLRIKITITRLKRYTLNVTRNHMRVLVNFIHSFQFQNQLSCKNSPQDLDVDSKQRGRDGSQARQETARDWMIYNSQRTRTWSYIEGRIFICRKGIYEFFSFLEGPYLPIANSISRTYKPNIYIVRTYSFGAVLCKAFSILSWNISRAPVWRRI